VAITGPPDVGVDVGAGINIPPAEFVQHFGRAVAYTITIPAGGSVSIPPDESRCLLALWGVSAAVTMIPDNVDSTNLTGPQVAPLGTPIVLTYTAHAQLTMLGWNFKSGPGAVATVVIARQDMSEVRPSGRKRKALRIWR
jgi:hypothetical protein